MSIAMTAENTAKINEYDLFPGPPLVRPYHTLSDSSTAFSSIVSSTLFA